MAVDIALVEPKVNTNSVQPVKTIWIGKWGFRLDTRLEWKIHIRTPEGLFCPAVRFSQLEHAKVVAAIFDDAFVVPVKWAF